jgi:hypothetical protein
MRLGCVKDECEPIIALDKLCKNLKEHEVLFPLRFGWWLLGVATAALSHSPRHLEI